MFKVSLFVQIKWCGLSYGEIHYTVQHYINVYVYKYITCLSTPNMWMFMYRRPTIIYLSGETRCFGNVLLLSSGIVFRNTYPQINIVPLSPTECSPKRFLTTKRRVI